MTIWEYKPLYKKTETRETEKIENALNDMGKQGWELVAVFGESRSGWGGSSITKPHLYLFKREVQTKTCSECGAENESDAEYCIECGGELSS